MTLVVITYQDIDKIHAVFHEYSTTSKNRRSRDLRKGCDDNRSKRGFVGRHF